MANMTTVQIDFETARKLRLIAKTFERSVMAQVRYMVNVEFDNLDVEKVVSAEPGVEKESPVYADAIEVA